MINDAKYYVNRRLKPPKAFWEWCYRDQTTYVWSNKSKTIVASDKKHKWCVTKRLTKKSRLTFISVSKNYQIILSTSKRIEIQTYRVCSDFVDGNQDFVSNLLNLEILENDRHIKVNGSNGGEFGLKPATGMFNTQYPDIYPNEWLNRLSNYSELKYITLYEEEVYPEDLPRIYKYRNRIEFLQKIKAQGLADDILGDSIHIDMRNLTMNFLKKNKWFFANSERTYKDYLLKKEIETYGVPMVLGVEKYLQIRDVPNIPNKSRLVKLQNYLIKQKCQFGYYLDYLSLLDGIGIPSEKQVKFPSDLVLSHDRAVETFNAIKKERELLQFNDRKHDSYYMEMTIGEYLFILPETSDDIVQEGINLKHCVGDSRYIDKHAKGTATIVLVRKKSSPDKSFFTMEYQHKEIVQLQGFKNREKVPSDLKLAAQKWLKQVITQEQLKIAS